jgi:hypothetical protein
MQLAGEGWAVHCSYALLCMFDIVQRKGAAARAAFNRTLLQPVLLELLPHMQDHFNIWSTADTPTASSSSSSSSSGGPSQTAAAAASNSFAEAESADVSELQLNLSQMLVGLGYNGEADSTQWN